MQPRLAFGLNRGYSNSRVTRPVTFTFCPANSRFRWSRAFHACSYPSCPDESGKRLSTTQDCYRKSRRVLPVWNRTSDHCLSRTAPYPWSTDLGRRQMYNRRFETKDDLPKSPTEPCLPLAVIRLCPRVRGAYRQNSCLETEPLIRP